MGDGTVMHNSRDSIIAGIQQYRDMFASVNSSVDAIVALKSTDKNEEWVSVWGKEVSKDKAGKSDSVYLQESWRFNKEGKVDMMLQHHRKIPVH
jgi:hypothetical protein